MKKINFILIICLLFVMTASAQKQIWTIDGQIIDFREIKIDTTEYIYYQNLKGKDKLIYKFDVFQVIEDSKTTVIYASDTTDCGTPKEIKKNKKKNVSESGYCAFSQSQMKYYVLGRQDGRLIKAPLYFVSGFAVGAATPISFPFIGLNSTYSPIVPLLFDISLGAIKVKDTNFNVSEYRDNEHYKLGYNMSVKKKRMNKLIFGTTGGLICGFITNYFIWKGLSN